MGISMSGLGMSNLGLSASSIGRADEAERSRRLQSILEVVGAKPGRVSEEGLLALCKRLGVAVEKTTPEHSYMLLIGDEAVCDVLFKDDEIASVNLQTGLDGEQEDLQFGATGSEILKRSLKPLPGQSKINVTLERFAENLEKLLNLDKLGNPQNGGVSCYNAIAGVYTSLRKLFEHEKKMALAVMEASTPHRNHKAERDVLCKKSGRPRLNGGTCLGLSLEYWMDRRHIVRNKAPSQSDKGKEKMDIDSQDHDTYPEDDDAEVNNMYSLTIECEASPSTLYNPIRISNEWISDKIEKPTDANDENVTIDNILLDRPSIDWLEPKPTYLEQTTSTDEAMDLSSAPGRLPNIRFVARFNPPLVVPYAVHHQLFQNVGLEPRPEDFQPTTFVGLALRPGEIDPGMMGATESTTELRSSRSVLAFDANGNETQQKHDMSLYLPKIEYSRTLESLPFSHPKSLIDMLPTLRQYAFTTSLLKEAFFDKEQRLAHNISLTPPQNDKPIQIDVNLSYIPPAPRLMFYIPHPLSISTPSLSTAASLISNFPTPDATSYPPLRVTLDVAPNGELVVGEQNVLRDEDGDMGMGLEQAERRQKRVQRLARGLDVCGDVGVWAEWVRREVGRGDGLKQT